MFINNKRFNLLHNKRFNLLQSHVCQLAKEIADLQSFKEKIITKQLGTPKFKFGDKVSFEKSYHKSGSYWLTITAHTGVVLSHHVDCNVEQFFYKIADKDNIATIHTQYESLLTKIK